jgi:hypothetical protein
MSKPFILKQARRCCCAVIGITLALGVLAVQRVHAEELPESPPTDVTFSYSEKKEEAPSSQSNPRKCRGGSLANFMQDCVAEEVAHDAVTTTTEGSTTNLRATLGITVTPQLAPSDSDSFNVTLKVYVGRPSIPADMKDESKAGVKSDTRLLSEKLSGWQKQLGSAEIEKLKKDGKIVLDITAAVAGLSTLELDKAPVLATVLWEKDERLFSIGRLKIRNELLESMLPEIERKIRETKRQLELAKDSGGKQIERFDEAYMVAERISNEKEAIDGRIRKKQARLNALSDKQNEVPESARTLAEQGKFLESEIRKTEGQIIANRNAGITDNTGLFGRLDNYREQLARINAEIERRMPDRSRIAGEMDRAKKELVALQNGYWEKIKSLHHAITEINISANLLNQTNGDIDQLKDELINLEKQKRMLDDLEVPVIERIRLFADSEGVYIAEKEKTSVEEIRKLRDEILETEEILRDLEREKKEAWDDFFDMANEATWLLTQIHGSSVSQGNGVWATLKDVASNSGAIMHSAKMSAAVDFGVDMYDVFVEGWGKGGPAGAIVQLVHKLAWKGVGKAVDATLMPPPESRPPDDTLQLDTILSREDIEGFNDDILAEVNNKYKLKLKHPLTTQSVIKTAVFRGAKAGLTRHAKDYGYKTLGVAMTKEHIFWAGRNPGGILSMSPDKISNELKRARENILGLTKPSEGLKSFAKSLKKGLIKDTIKATLKYYIKEQENEAWEKFFLAEAAQVNLFQVYSLAKSAYWSTYDKLAELKQRYEKLIYNLDEDAGFKIIKNNTFDSDASLRIIITLESPSYRNETVILGNVTAEADGLHNFVMNAESIKVSSKSKRVKLDLNIKQQ